MEYLFINYYCDFIGMKSGGERGGGVRGGRGGGGGRGGPSTRRSTSDVDSLKNKEK